MFNAFTVCSGTMQPDNTIGKKLFNEIRLIVFSEAYCFDTEQSWLCRSQGSRMEKELLQRLHKRWYNKTH